MFVNIRKASFQLAKLIEANHQIIVTHGNGPQVGSIFLRNQRCSKEIPPWSLNLCVAESEGVLGYIFQQQLINELALLNRPNSKVVTLITQMLVSLDDPAWKDPDKPVGNFFTEEEAREKKSREPDVVLKYIHPYGWRVVVPSPRPIQIIEEAVVKPLVNTGTCIIASGGGGIPVVRQANGTLKGVDCVVDKDFASVILARLIPDLDMFICLTDVDAVYENFGSSRKKRIATMTVLEAEERLAQGQFASGSMKPKVQAAVQFVKESKGKPALITGLDNLTEALSNPLANVGTLII